MECIGSPILTASHSCLPLLARLACRSDEGMFSHVLPSPIRVYPLFKTKQQVTLKKNNFLKPSLSLLHNCHTPLPTPVFATTFVMDTDLVIVGGA